MLLELSIENFVLIENIDISFTKGLNVMSGETGAGKSIVIDAINLALGGKSSKNYVRRGKDKAIIQVVFDISTIEIKHLLSEYGIDCEDDILILSREVFGTGRSISRINGRIVQMAFINQISKLLIDIHGQHEHQSLLYPDNHLDMLDLYGNESLQKVKNIVQKKYTELKALENKLKSLGQINGQERERRIDLIKFQINEIDSCNLKINEDDELMDEFEKLKNGEVIYQTVNESYELISAGLNEDYSISSVLSNIVTKLEKVSDFDNQLKTFHTGLQDVFYRLEDLSTDMRLYSEDFNFDQDYLIEIQTRLDVINNLKRKYGNTIEEILQYRNKLQIELSELEDNTNKIEIISKDITQCKEEYLKQSNNLSLLRKKVAKEFEIKIQRELKDLNLEKALFKVDIRPNLNKDGKTILTKDGIDKIEFMISTNPGEPIKPLSKVASGGEISRIMLAIKVVFAKIDNIPSLIFDEIDTGISGKTANIVGEKLALISTTHQTICITHLPQITVMADNHLYIEKTLYEDDTITEIKKLNKKERIQEISRLIGGNKITNLTIKNAEEMLKMAEDLKKNLSK